MATFYVRIFTGTGCDSYPAMQRAEAVVAEVVGEAPVVLVEPYEKLDLYSHRITASVDAAHTVCLALFDRFLAEAATGWAIVPFDQDVTLREAGWDHRRTAEMLLDPSVRAAFLGVESGD